MGLVPTREENVSLSGPSSFFTPQTSTREHRDEFSNPYEALGDDVP
jgi:hypothetical protein